MKGSWCFTNDQREDVGVKGGLRPLAEMGEVNDQPIPLQEKYRENAQKYLASVQGGGISSRTRLMTCLLFCVVAVGVVR